VIGDKKGAHFIVELEITRPIQTSSAQEVIMIKRLVLISVALLVVFIVSAFTMQPNIPEFITTDGVTRNFCSVFSRYPSRSGNNAVATGYVACLYPVSWLEVDVQVIRYSDSQCTTPVQWGYNASNYCSPNKDYCEATASLGLTSGTHYYNSATSGYWPGDENLYISDCVRITK